MEILFIAHRVPHPPNKGDRIRSFHLLRFLAGRANVHLACLADEPVADFSLAALNRLCKRVCILPLPKRKRWLQAAWSVMCGRTATEGLFLSDRLTRAITAWSGQTKFDAVVAFCSSTARYLDIQPLREIPLVVDLVDVDSQKWLDYARQTHGPLRWMFSLEGNRLRRLETALADRSRAIVLVSNAEARILKEFSGCQNVHAITNGVDLDYFRPQSTTDDMEQRRCTFVGALDYRANVDGITWFCQQVWPAVHARLPHSVFSIVGRRPTAAVRRLAKQPGVELIGEVDDVRAHYARAALTVAPLRVARGVQNKVLEALAMGKAVIGSSEALEGLNVTTGEDVCEASTPEEWITQVGRLLEHPDVAARLGAAGRRFVEKHHCWETCLRPFEQLIDHCGLPSDGAHHGGPACAFEVVG
jgi:sugar transferase (PEP-CTERM/EpsH1 system associated)